jgi:hypothetical protein
VAVKLAQEVAPDEIDLAPDYVNAYMAGGKERQALFLSSKEAAGSSFGAVDMAVLLPAVLNVIALVWNQAQPILNNAAWIQDGVALVKDVLTIGDLTSKRKKVDQLPDTQAYHSIKELVIAIENQVNTLPLKADQRELFSYHILKVILDNPIETQTFIKQTRKG